MHLWVILLTDRQTNKWHWLHESTLVLLPKTPMTHTGHNGNHTRDTQDRNQSQCQSQLLVSLIIRSSAWQHHIMTNAVCSWTAAAIQLPLTRTQTIIKPFWSPDVSFWCFSFQANTETAAATRQVHSQMKIPYLLHFQRFAHASWPVICSRNWGLNPVPNMGNYYPVFHHDSTKYHEFWPVFASIHDIKQYCSSNVLSTSHSQTSLFDYS